MTEKIYYDKPYLDKWQTEIKAVEKDGNKYKIVLNQTAFYPEGGGQPSDMGYIDGVPVEDVYENTGVIYHILPSEPSNSIVNCQVDFERRFDHMQQHTGQHLLSAVFADLYQGQTSSFHLGEEYCSIDISLSAMDATLLEAVENTANQYIYKNLEVKSYVVAKEKLAEIPLRKYPSVDEDIRIVEIDKLDYSPCCGTHVKTTGQLGMIKIIKTENYKGITRVYFHCGQRALDDYRSKQGIIQSVCSYFSINENELMERVENEKTKLKTSLDQIKELQGQLAQIEAKVLLDTADNYFISKKYPNKSFTDLQTIGAYIQEAGDYLAVLSTETDKKVLLAHNGSLALNCGQIIKEHCSHFNGRGGGSPRQAQVAFNTIEDLEAFQYYMDKYLQRQGAK